MTPSMNEAQLHDATTSRPTVASVAKAAAVLRAFGPMTAAMTVRQLAERTGIPRSTVHALCTTLCDAGLLESGAGHGYRLGPTLATLGGQVVDRSGLLAAAEAPLAGLQLHHAYELHLAQLVDSWVVIIDRRLGRRPMLMGDDRVGLRALAHHTGCGRGALSALPSGERRRRIEVGCHHDGERLPCVATLDAMLERARTVGYVVSGDLHPGRRSVGAPVLGADGRPVGGVSIASTTDRMPPATVRTVAGAVVDLAAGISRRLRAVSG
jgi:DNA-binding IclR family transcriptional regulator